ncbi:hypothetical protein C2845_PM07G01830 [Panicum miliaceum]|uniref:Phosphatidic acid phosphatase type 2/haloperoxidase domain-containing protein n=1 Tax=Panicum miliaceum TaxID=4540 RepID=A0A3L6SJ48_PANMI|nr:hypothetical protein C2845_PM07G01830 [Panicum miliaceum]
MEVGRTRKPRGDHYQQCIYRSGSFGRAVAASDRGHMRRNPGVCAYVLAPPTNGSPGHFGEQYGGGARFGCRLTRGSLNLEAYGIGMGALIVYGVESDMHAAIWSLGWAPGDNMQGSQIGDRVQGPQLELGSHTIQTHGARLARKHTHDWVALILLAAVVVALHYAPPFNRFVGKDMMTDLRYPVKPSTVPAWAVPIISILCPWVIFISIYVARRDVYDLHHATLGVLFAVLITAVFTDAIKTAVGRPRPDFFWRCFPDGKQLYDQVTGGVICHGNKSFLTDGRKSFPSGHTSLFTLPGSFAGLGFLSLYLSGKIKAFDRQGHVAKLCIVVLPLLLASLVGISRVDDYRHHWEDVFVGGLIGWGPYAYFHMLEELQAANSNDAQIQQHTATGGQHIGLSRQEHEMKSRNDLESGSM